LGKKRRAFLSTQIFVSFARFLLKSKLLMLLLLLCAFGFWAGANASRNYTDIPFEELFENMTVMSYRESPSDTSARFVVELAARGKVFRQYDVDAHAFTAPVRGHDYGRSISGTRYRPLRIRGHVDHGFWLELPDSSEHALLPDQFEELYRSTLDFVKPVSVVTTVLGTLSGYSIGYRAATWSTSLANPKVQKHVLEIPNMGRAVAREAWRRVLLEPVVMARESDADRFAAVRGMQRIYTNFYRLALADSDRFIPQEAARLDSMGHAREARIMLAFAESVRRVVSDTCNLNSSDFRAVEDWASLLDRRGHWARGAMPASREDRVRYLGTLAYYGIAPTAEDQERIWMGPRYLVLEGDMEGFVADEIPMTGIGCPIAWREWLRRDNGALAGNVWTAQWVRESRQVAQAVDFSRDVARKLHGK
jgi:hypothetical protein